MDFRKRAASSNSARCVFKKRSGSWGAPAHGLQRLLTEQSTEVGFGPYTRSDPEELRGILGETRVAPAPEGLVTRYHPGRQSDDRLEDRFHGALANELLQLPDAFELVRDLDAARERQRPSFLA